MVAFHYIFVIFIQVVLLSSLFLAIVPPLNWFTKLFCLPLCPKSKIFFVLSYYYFGRKKVKLSKQNMPKIFQNNFKIILSSSPTSLRILLLYIFFVFVLMSFQNHSSATHRCCEVKLIIGSRSVPMLI